MTVVCFINFPLTGGSNGHPLHGIYDNGLSGGLHSSSGGYGGLDRNETLTASYLYPELLNVTSTSSSQSTTAAAASTFARSSRSQRIFRRPPSSHYSLSSTVSSTSTVSSIHQRDSRQQRQHRMVHVLTYILGHNLF